MTLVPTDGERRRIERLMTAIMTDLALDLSGIGVLTEAASGFFSTTCLMTAIAGAEPVVAVCRDSRFGKAAEVIEQLRLWARNLGVANRVEFQIGRPHLDGINIDLVTNLGFVRPIDAALIDALSEHAVVSLMWEPWEFRSNDIDLQACRRRRIPVIGTCETHPRIRTFEYLAPVAAKILLENAIEVLGSKIVVVGSDPFGEAIARGLIAMGALVTRVHLSEHDKCIGVAFAERGQAADAIVIAEHRDGRPIIGGDQGIDPDRLVRDGTVIVHICGAIDSAAASKSGITIHPGMPAPFGTMTVSTAYAGPTPVIDLHAAGLKIGEIVVRNRRDGKTAEQAVEAALASSLALRLEDPVQYRR